MLVDTIKSFEIHSDDDFERDLNKIRFLSSHIKRALSTVKYDYQSLHKPSPQYRISRVNSFHFNNGYNFYVLINSYLSVGKGSTQEVGLREFINEFYDCINSASDILF
ncbi:hypothetical protein HZS_5846 [Henneguya salminicola]|nr:hypothetical protein HZS_5846 [Henneguya salminicola]